MSDLPKLSIKYKAQILNSAKFATSVFAAKVQSRTPKAVIKGGSLQASWTPNIGEPMADNINVRDGETRRHDVVGTIGKMQIGDVFTLSNGQPYAMRIEYEGHSPQAPNGMIGPTRLEWQSIVNAAARKAKNGK